MHWVLFSSQWSQGLSHSKLAVIWVEDKRWLLQTNNTSYSTRTRTNFGEDTTKKAFPKNSKNLFTSCSTLILSYAQLTPTWSCTLGWLTQVRRSPKMRSTTIWQWESRLEMMPNRWLPCNSLLRLAMRSEEVPAVRVSKRPMCSDLYARSKETTKMS